MKRSMKKIMACAMAAVMTVQVVPALGSKAATADSWKLTVNTEVTLDRIVFSGADLLQPEKQYFVGLLHDKVAVLDEAFKVVAQTEYKAVQDKFVIYQGKTAMVVQNADNLYGICSVTGEELEPCKSVSMIPGNTLEGHSILQETDASNVRHLIVDGKRIADIEGNPALEKVQEQVKIVNYNTVTRNYEVYGLDGTKEKVGTREEVFGTVSFGTTHDKGDVYNKAVAGWLKDKVSLVNQDVKGKFEALGYTIESEDEAKTSYNYVSGRTNEMYYYVFKSLTLSGILEENSEKYTENVAKVTYGYVYDEKQNLVAEGTCNMDSEYAAYPGTNSVGDVYLLTLDGTFQKMDGITGEVIKGTKAKENSMICKEILSKDYAKANNFDAYIAKQEGMTNILFGNEKYEKKIVYQYNFVDNVTASEIVLPDLKETLSYSKKISENCYVKEKVENKTDFYQIDTKANKVIQLDMSVNEIESNAAFQVAGGMAIVADKKNACLLAGKGEQTVTKTFKELGAYSDNSVINMQKAQDDFCYAIVLSYPKKNEGTDYEQIDYGNAKMFAVLYNGKKNIMTVQEITKDEETALTNTEYEDLSVEGKVIRYALTTVLVLDSETATMKLLDTKAMILDKGYTMLGAQVVNGDVYLRYGVERDGTTYYGFMDLSGKIFVDADKCKEQYGARLEVLGEYLAYGKTLLKKNGEVVFTNGTVEKISKHDDVMGMDVESGIASIYGEKADGSFWGCLYDANNNKSILEYENKDSVYVKGTVYGSYILLQQSDIRDVAWLNCQSDKIEQKSKGEVFVNEASKTVFVVATTSTFVESTPEVTTTVAVTATPTAISTVTPTAVVATQTPEVTVTPEVTSQPEITEKPVDYSGTYTVKNVSYKVTNVSKATVKVTKAKNKSSIDVPATVKIKGKTFKVTAIGTKAFYGNKKTTKVTVGAKVTAIGKQAFAGCSKLKTIVVKGTGLKSIGANALKGTNKSLVVKVPAKKKAAYKKLLKGKGNAKVKVK